MSVAWPPAAGAGGAAADAALAAALFAVDPVGTGGVAVRAAHGPRRDAWLASLRSLLPAGAPWCRLPLHVADERLLGGLDLGATLHAGRPVAQRGVLADADGGVLLLAMAERLAAGTAARVVAAMDAGAVQVERDGIGLRQDARFGVLALDEGIGDDEGVPAKLLDRLAFQLRLDEVGPSSAPAGSGGNRDTDLPGNRSRPDRSPAPGGFERAGAAGMPPCGQATDRAVLAGTGLPAGADAEPRRDGGVDRALPAGTAPSLPAVGDVAAPYSAADVQAARERLPRVTAGDDVVQALCAAALALGVPSLRASLLALRTACAAAALAGRESVDAVDAALAARLVLAPRATQLPAASNPADAAAPDQADDTDRSAADGETETSEPPAPPLDQSAPPPADPAEPTEPTEPAEPADRPQQSADGALDDAVLDAAVASIPAGLLAELRLGLALRSPSPASASGRAGAAQHGRLRGRPNGVRRGQPTAGARLNVLETLRAAAPWQVIRRREDESAGRRDAPVVRVRRDDFRITRFKQRSVTTTLFVVDASGSSALHRLAEAKGAVELLLADCYVRRDQVALLAFRGRAAELLLPPTRSLVRAKRSLAALPGGGGTPLAAGIDAAYSLADAVRRRGETPIVVLLTDGRANIARDGTPGRGPAGVDALAAARLFRAAGFSALLLDTSAQPQPSSAALAREMGAVYLPLPHAGAAGLSQAVLTVQAARDGARADAGGRRRAD